MDPAEARSTKLAFWCGILEGDALGVAPGREVRTVRGQYTTFRAPGKKRTGVAVAPFWPPRRGERRP
jgi:hypothetical protein